MVSLKQFSNSFLNLSTTKHYFSNKRKLILFFVVGALFIIIWQMLFYANANELDPSYRNRAASGMFHDNRFFYFFFYTGLYPITSTDMPDNYSEEYALRYLSPENAANLRTEWHGSVRFGDLLKIFLFYPDAWLKGAPINPSVRTANAFFFIASLIFLFGAFCYIRQPVLGMGLVLFLGSHPLQVSNV